jgi:hypothetical protein
MKAFTIAVIEGTRERRLFRLKQVGRMKKKRPPAKTPLPRFRSAKEAADYFQTHSVAEVWDPLSETQRAKASKALERSVRERHTAAKSPKFSYKRNSLKLENRERTVRGLGFARVLRDRERG